MTGQNGRRSRHWYWLAVFAALVAACVAYWRTAQDPRVMAGASRSRPMERLSPAESSQPVFAISDSTQGMAGVVASNRGQGLSGALVCALCATCDISASSAALCGLSDSSGRFVLANVPVGSYVVSATLAGYEVGVANGGKAVQLSAAQDLTDLRVVLAPREVTLSGSVMDASGGPIAAARVQVARAEYSVRPVLELQTDEQGRFSASLPPGMFAIRADATGYAPSIVYRTLPTTDAQLLLMPGGSIEGTVVDAITGEPVAGVNVSSVGTQAATLLAPVRSGADGSFSLSGLEPGRYALRAEADRYRGTSGALAVELGGRVTGVVVRVTRAVVVEGKVIIGASGKPCEEGYVALGPSSPFSVAARLATAEPAQAARDRTAPEPKLSVFAPIEPSGSVRLRGVTPGHYHVTLTCKGHAFEDGPAVLDVRDEDQAVVWKVGQRSGLVVRVQDERGKPIPFANLSLEFPPGSFGGTVSQALRVDETGRASEEGCLYPGRYVITADPSYGVEPVAVELVNGKTVETTLTIAGSSGLRVEVRTPQGKLVDDVQVLARAQDKAGKSPVERRGVSVGGGTFLVRPLPAGEITVEVLAGPNPPVRAADARGEPVRLSAGEEALLKVTLPCQAEMRGVVVDDAGAPVPDAWVSASQGERSEGGGSSFASAGATRVLSDGQGSFALNGLCSNVSYRVQAQHDAGASGEVVGVRPQSGIKVPLNRHGSVEGVVVSANGRPVTDFVLQLRHVATARSRGVRVETSDGRFRLDDVPSGPSRIEVRSADAAGHQEVVVPQGKPLGGVRLVLEPSAATNEPDSHG